MVKLALISSYQTEVERTLNLSLDKKAALANYALGLSGEVGEVVEPIKKHHFHEKELDLENLKKELGDVLWYCAAICSELNLPLAEVMQGNVEKLKKRHPEGFKTSYKGDPT